MHSLPAPSSAVRLSAAAVTGGSAFIEFFIDPILGNASDMFGRKAIAVLAVSGGVLAFGIVAVWPSKVPCAPVDVPRAVVHLGGASSVWVGMHLFKQCGPSTAGGVRGLWGVSRRVVTGCVCCPV
jgi:hypothetical protein